MRIVFVHGLNSNFNSVLEVLKTCRDFQYRSNSRISSDPPFWLRSFVISWKGVFATSYRMLKFTSISCHEILSNFDNTHKSCFLTEFIQSVFWWKRINLLEIILHKNFGIFKSFVLNRYFSFDFPENNWLTFQYDGFPHAIWLVIVFITYRCHCSVDTELIDRKNNAINCINCILVSTEVYGYFPFSFTFNCPLDKGVVERKMGCPLSANSSNISSATWSQAPCGLFFGRIPLFLRTWSNKDHWPIPNLLANVFTKSALFKHSFLLSYLSQEMSLNIDINRILPVKFSGVCPKELRRLLILSKSCNDVNPGKYSTRIP